MNRPPVFLNFHGFMGAPDNKNSKALSSLYQNATIVSPEIDYLTESPEKILELGVLCAKKYVGTDAPLILVGQSLGGWVADQLSRSLDLPCLLTNPCLDPHLCKVITDSAMPKAFLADYAAKSTTAQNHNAFTLCTKTDEVLGAESFDRCTLLGGWLKEVKGRHSSIECLQAELAKGVSVILQSRTASDRP